MNRKWAMRVGTILLASAGGLVAAEVTLRLTGLASPPAVLSVNERQAESIPGIFVPRERVIERKNPRFPHRVTINSLGYRGPEVSRDKPAGATRIFFAGDSFTWGDLVDDGETVPARLEDHLRTFCSGIEVINAGVGGTTIDAQRQIIQDGLELEPDLVILMFYDNDLSDLIPPTFWDMMLENRRRKSEFPVSVAYGILNRTALWTVLRRARLRFGQKTKGEGAPTEDQGQLPEAAMSDLKDRYRSEFFSLTTELREHQVPLLLAGFPAHLSLDNPDARSNHLPWLSELASAAGVSYVGLRAPLQAVGRPLEDLYFLPSDGHPRPLAYDIGARELARSLRSLNSEVDWCASNDRAARWPETPVTRSGAVREG